MLLLWGGGWNPLLIRSLKSKRIYIADTILLFILIYTTFSLPKNTVSIAAIGRNQADYRNKMLLHLGKDVLRRTIFNIKKKKQVLF